MQNAKSKLEIKLIDICEVIKLDKRIYEKEQCTGTDKKKDHQKYFGRCF